MLIDIEYNGHKLQAIEFTGEGSIDTMDLHYGISFMDNSETDWDCKTLYLFNKKNRRTAVKIGDYVMRTNGGKIFKIGWRAFRDMYYGAIRVTEAA